MKAIELKMPDEVYQKLEHRAKRGSIERFRAAMAKVPNGAPMPGVDLPES